MNTGTVGATRNRTDLFLKYRNHARGASRTLGLPSTDRQSLKAWRYHEDGIRLPTSQASRERGTQRLLDTALPSLTENGSAAELGSAGVASALPPRYVEFKEAIRTEMLTIKQKMGDLRALHGKAALTSFDDSGNHEMDIEVLTQETTRLFRKAEVRLQQFGQGGSTSEADEKVKQNVQRTLAIELQKLSVQFRKQQKAYLNKLRKTSAASSSFSLLDETGPTARVTEEYDPGFSEIQTLRVDTMDAFAQERDREVRNILQSINDLAQIMKDLSVLVIDQGTIVDRIDYNMEQVATKVDEGVKQLLKAEKYQKQTGMAMCIMFLVCAVIVMLIVYIFKIILLR